MSLNIRSRDFLLIILSGTTGAVVSRLLPESQDLIYLTGQALILSAVVAGVAFFIVYFLSEIFK